MKKIVVEINFNVSNQEEINELIYFFDSDFFTMCMKALNARTLEIYEKNGNERKENKQNGKH